MPNFPDDSRQSKDEKKPVRKKKDNLITIDCFKNLKEIGKGAFSEVFS